MVLGRAVGILGTLAGVNTLLLPACQRVVTISVEEALVGLAAVIGTALVVLGALAESSMPTGCANGIGAALLIVARVLAFAVVAGLC